MPVSIKLFLSNGSPLTRHVVHDHVQVLLVLEGKVELDDPLGVGVRHDVPLLPEEGRVGPLDHLVLAEELHGEHLLGVLVPDQLHLAKGPPPDDLDQVEVVRLHPLLPNVPGHVDV